VTGVTGAEAGSEPSRRERQLTAGKPGLDSRGRGGETRGGEKPGSLDQREGEAEGRAEAPGWECGGCGLEGERRAGGRRLELAQGS
jgi:hypothetical protein